jgi:hypothetical protein
VESSITTIRITIARVLARKLARCPCCQCRITIDRL